MSPVINWARFAANCSTSLPPTSTITPRPNWAGRPVTFIVVCMLTWVPDPEGSGTMEARTVADAVPAPRVSLPDASTTATRASGSRSMNFAVPLYVSETGPTLTLIRPLTTSPSTSSTVAPGMQGAIRSTSSRTSQAWSGGTGTVKEWSSSIAIGTSLSLVLAVFG